MNEIRTCSIGGLPFNIEIDAFEILNTYIESLKSAYINDPDGAEIIADIESRIAELILSAQSERIVVAKPLVDNIIAQMGSADDIGSSGGDNTYQQTDTTGATSTPLRHRRLYRDVDSGAVGGVCSGIAAFFNCDPTIIRIVTFLLIFFGGASFWIYLILWIVIPPALTARQKLEMRGEPVTASTIRDSYSADSSAPQQPASPISSIVATIGSIILIAIKIIAGFFLIVFSIAAITLICTLVAICFNLDIIPELVTTSPTIVILPIITALSFMIISCYFLVQFLNSRRINATTIVILLALWVALLVSTVLVTISINEGFDDHFVRSHRTQRVIHTITNDSDKKTEKSNKEDIEFDQAEEIAPQQ